MCESSDPITASFPDGQGHPDKLCAVHAYQEGVIAKPVVGASRAACEVWDRLEIRLGRKLQHKHYEVNQEVPSGKEWQVPNTRYHVDAYDEITGEMYEYLGTHVHGFPPNHPRYTAVSSYTKRSNTELYQETMQRMQLIANLTTRTVYYVWSHNARALEFDRVEPEIVNKKSKTA
jgi:hypothetical protein